MMVKGVTLKKFLYCRQNYTLPMLLLWLLLCYFLAMEYKTVLLRIKTKASFTSFRQQSLFPLWILPRVTWADLSPDWTAPDNWTILMAPGMDEMKSCRTCYRAESSMQSLLHKWTSLYSLKSNSTLTATVYRMASAVTAIHRGAVSILLTSDFSSLKTSMSRLLLDNQPDGVRGVEYFGQRLTKDSFHFLHRRKTSQDNPCKYRLRRRMNPLWTVGIRCHAGVTHGDQLIDTPTFIDYRSPPIFSASPKFSISDFSDAYFDYDGLWALFPSFLPKGIQTSIWGLWAQRMLQETGKESAIIPLPCPRGVKSLRTAPEPRTKTLRAHEYIRNWQCSFNHSFFDCAFNLGESLLQTDFVKTEEIMLLRLWIKELRKSHYIEPRRKTNMSSDKDLLLGCVIHSPARVVPRKKMDNWGNPFLNIFPFCKNLPKRTEVIDPFEDRQLVRSTKVADIALVIIFYDASIYANIRFLQDLYARYFPHLIYCGPDFRQFYAVYKSLKLPLSYIEVPDTKGFVAYECVSRAIMMNYDVSGYLEMADDVILNTWTLGNIPRDRFWFQKDLRTASRHQQIMNDFALSYPFPWWPWTVHGQMWGAKAMANVWRTFESIQTFNNTKSKQIVTSFLRTLHHNSGAYDRFFYSSSDIFYVPSKFRQSWAMLSDIFFSNNVFLDIAVPTMMNGMDATSNIIRMEGIYLWYNDRGNYPAHYRSYHQFFHPWKMGWIHRSDHANFLCFHLLPNIVHDLMDKESPEKHTNATYVHT